MQSLQKLLSSLASAGRPLTRAAEGWGAALARGTGAVAISTAISSSSRGTGESNLRVPCRWAGCVTRSGLGDVSGSEGAASQLQRERPREGPRSPHLPAELGVGTRHGGACQPGPREAHAGLTASGKNQICTV